MVRATVRLVKTKNCFVNIPAHVARGLDGASEGAVILRLSWDGAATEAAATNTPSWAFASWNGGISDAQSGAIEVPLALAQVMGLAAALDSDAYLSVAADPAGYVPTASRVCLEPLSCDDWEILEANAEHLEGHMLTQVCVAYTGQVMPIWVHNTSLISLQVVSVETPGGAPAAGCVRLTADTEVAVSPKPRRRRSSREGEPRRQRFRSSGLLRVAPPPPGWKLEGTALARNGGGSGCGRPYVLAHPATLTEIDGWNSSPSSRAPWPSPAFDDVGSAVPPPTTSPPNEALAVLWRDGSSSPGPGNGRGTGVGQGGGGGWGPGGGRHHRTLDGSSGAAALRLGGGGDGDSTAAAAGAKDSCGGSAGGGIVVVLREDARVPPGHVAEAVRDGGRSGLLLGRAGLALLRRVARVRVLSVAEGATVLPSLVFSRVVAPNCRTSTGSKGVTARTVGNYPAPTSAPGCVEAAAASNETLRQMLSYAWRGGETDTGVVCRSRRVPSGGAGGTLAASGGLLSRHGGGAEVGGAGESRRDIQHQQQQHQQQQQQQQLVPTSGSGLRQLASSFVPLVLDEGAVVSLPSLPPPPPMTAAPTGNPNRGNNNSTAWRCAPADLTADFVVEFSSKNTPSAAAGFPLPTEASSATGTGQGDEAAGALRYVVLACQEDVDRAVAEALVGPDVALPPGWHETTAVGEGGGGVLGGVEEQMRAVSNLLAPVLVRPVAAARSRLGVSAPAGGVVLHGAAGAGKTALALETARRLRESYLAMAGTEVVSCRDLQGRKMADVLGALEEAFSSARRHAPSLLVLDDLDKIAPAEGDEGAGAFNAQAARIAERLEDLLAQASGGTAAVGVLATVGSVAALNPRLTRSGMLDAQVEIPPPRPAARASMLKSLLRGLGASGSAAAAGSHVHGGRGIVEACQRDVAKEALEEEDGGDGHDDDDDDGGIDWEYLSSKTEGCQARDLAKLVKRAVLNSALRRMKEAETEVTISSALAVPSAREHQHRRRQRTALSPSRVAINGGTARVEGGDCGKGGHDGGTLNGDAPCGAWSNGSHNYHPPATYRDNHGSSSGNLRHVTVDDTGEGSSGSHARDPQGAAHPGGGGGVGVDMEDLEAALEGFSAESLRGAGLFRSSVEWGDVGGLSGVRSELREILELPVKYGRLFEATPTRLPTGALLYGPPGCGKTLLAGAVAAECGLNFISVKGPEVLDKYIGASEQAVRSLFARAASAAPCVLFFDEFEAVAPRRGNDNTGVTDRVVNQLLTFLDGVEGRDGVYVLGATSRPDLIDSALLRPGRLDRQLYCGFPDAAEREDILRAVCRRTPMSREAREFALAGVATSPKAAAFTGADLQAVIETAQLAAIHSYLEALNPNSDESPKLEGGDSGTKGFGQGMQRTATDGGNSRGSGSSRARASTEALAVDHKPSLEGAAAEERGRIDTGSGAQGADGKIIPENGSGNDTANGFGHSPENGPGIHALANVPANGASAGVDLPDPRHRDGRTGGKKRGGVEVSADNVWAAFLSTRPSLSADDRARYDSAYRKFRGGSRPADFNPISSVDDGTLRTALK